MGEPSIMQMYVKPLVIGILQVGYESYERTLEGERLDLVKESGEVSGELEMELRRKGGFLGSLTPLVSAPRALAPHGLWRKVDLGSNLSSASYRLFNFHSSVALVKYEC